jgi:hypothetical protein
VLLAQGFDQGIGCKAFIRCVLFKDFGSVFKASLDRLPSLGFILELQDLSRDLEERVKLAHFFSRHGPNNVLYFEGLAVQKWEQEVGREPLRKLGYIGLQLGHASDEQVGTLQDVFWIHNFVRKQLFDPVWHVLSEVRLFLLEDLFKEFLHKVSTRVLVLLGDV